VAVLGFAAQSLFGNVLAGTQTTFGGALRLDDVVVTDGERAGSRHSWGAPRGELIRLIYCWCTSGTTAGWLCPPPPSPPRRFQNRTRAGSSRLGTVELEVDWSVPVEPMRENLRRLVTENQATRDGRVSVLQVTDAVRVLVRLRALVSASDAGTLWDLRCLVSGRLVTC
jgi:hypothetical protein